MKIAYLIIGLIIIYSLIRTTAYLRTICINQIKQAKLLQEIISQINKK